MKYFLRFGMIKDGEWKSFASCKSCHLPKKGELVYLGDEMIKDTWKLGVELGTVYKVVQKITNFNNYYDEEDGCTAIEITVVETNISQ